VSMNKTSIDWPWKPLYTWNPVVGCKRGCPYCYARKMNTRYGWLKDFAELKFYPERLKQPPEKVENVFVGSMTDIDYWRIEWVQRVMAWCRMNRAIDFYFLSKNPCPYLEYRPDNCFIGLTMTLQEDFAGQYEKINKFGFNKSRFLSLEPLLGTLKLDRTFFTGYHAIIVGAMTGPGAVKPKREWIDSIKALNLDNVYWKNNIGGNGKGGQG